MKDLTKIYKGPEVLMNCPSLGLEPEGFGSGKNSRIFREKSRECGMWSLQVPKSSQKKWLFGLGTN